MVLKQYDLVESGRKDSKVDVGKFKNLESGVKDYKIVKQSLRMINKSFGDPAINKDSKTSEENFREVCDWNLQESLKSNYSLIPTERSAVNQTNSSRRVSTHERKKKEYSSLFIFGPRNKVRLAAVAITKAKSFEYFILLSIITTCVIMALDVPLPNQDKSQMNIFADKTELYLLAIFGTEAVLKIIANGFILHPHSYLRSLWNVIDFVVVIISFITSLEFVTKGDQVNVKSFRAIRVLRPLKLITGVPSLHIIMTSIMKAVVPLLQVLYLLSFVISIYAIIGLEFMVERFHYSCKNNITEKFRSQPCDNQPKKSFFVHGSKCFENEICSSGDPGINNGISSFDNIFFAMLTVFQCVTTEGWSDIMYYTFDTMDENGYIWATYYVSLIMLGSFFMINLVLGVLNGEFAKERNKVENRRAFIKLRERMKLDRCCEFYSDWISKGEELIILEQKEYASQILQHQNLDELNKNIGVNPVFLFFSRRFRLQQELDQTSKLGSFHLRIKHLQLKARNLVKHEAFFWFVLIIVFLNTFVMSTYHYRAPKWLADSQKYAEKTFISIFIAELLLKVFALNFRGYCRSSFNVFEFIVIVVSLIEAYSTWEAGLRVLRCLRLLRVFKVTKYWSTLRNLVASLMNAMNSILSLLFLLLLYMLITALLGMQLFSGRFTEFDDYPSTNFDNFPNSLLAVFQVITGEDWYSVMYNGMSAYKAPEKVSGILVSLYFLFLVIFGNYTLLNVFLAIAVDNLTNAEILTKDEEEEKNTRIKSLKSLSKTESRVPIENQLADNGDATAKEHHSLKIEEISMNIIGDIKRSYSPAEGHNNDFSSLDVRHSKLSLNHTGVSKLSPELLATNQMEFKMSSDKNNIQNKITIDDNPDIFFNSNAEVVSKPQLKTDQLCAIPPIDDFLDFKFKNKDKQFNTNKNSLDFITNDGYKQLDKNVYSIDDDFKLQITNEGFRNMLKINIVHQKQNLPVLNVSSLFFLTPSNRFRLLCHQIVQSKYFDWGMIIIILLSSAVLGIEDPINDQSPVNIVVSYCDYIFTFIFGLEILLKIIDTGFILHKGAFIRNSWNKLDTFVFICSLLSIFILRKETYKTSVLIKVLRVLRVLRPIKAIQKVKKLKIVFQCMVYSLKNVAFVLIITLLMLFIFACIGVQLFQGRFFYCEDESIRTSNECQGVFYKYTASGNQIMTETLPEMNVRTWKRRDFHFDNVIEAIVTLYVCSTEDNWPTIMHQAMDITEINQGPLKMNSGYMAIYFIIFVIIFTFMIINIYIALIILTFQKQGEKQIQGGLDKNQHDCLNYVLNSKPRKRFMPKNESSISFYVWLLVESRPFDYFVTSLIVLNSIQLMMKYKGMSEKYQYLLQYINIGFTILFVMEAFVKIVAYRLCTHLINDFQVIWLPDKNYFKDIWNLFDLAVIIGGLMDITLTYSKTTVLDPTMFRLFRAARVMKLLRKGSSIRIMLWTFLQSFKALPYVTGLILLTSYVYAVIGIQLFGTIKLGKILNEKNNFRNIYRALLVLFRCSTGDNWSVIMHACYDAAECDDVYLSNNKNAECGNTVLARLYFMSYMFLSMFFLLNLFVAVIMDNFEYLTRDSSILSPHHLDEFVKCWSEYDPQAIGNISHDKLYEFMCFISPPIGFGAKCPKTIAYKRLIRMNMPVNPDGTVSFYTTLLSLIRVGLDVYSKGDSSQNDNQLKRTIKSLWPNISSKTLDKFFPDSTDEHQLTVGKIFCIKLFVMNFRKCKGRSNEETLELDAVPSTSNTVIDRIHYFIPGFKHHKASNDSSFNDVSKMPRKEVMIRRNVTFSGGFTKAQHEHRQARENSISKKERNQVRRRSSWGDVSSFFRFGSSRDKSNDATIKLDNNNTDNTKLNLSTTISLSPASLSPDAAYVSSGIKGIPYNAVARNSISNGKLLTRSNSGGTGGSVHRRITSNQSQYDANKNLTVNSARQKQHYQYHSRNMQSISAPATPRGSSHGTTPINFPNIDARNKEISPSNKLNVNSATVYKRNGSFVYSDQAQRGYIEPNNSPYSDHFNQGSPYINHNNHKSDPDVKYRLNGKTNEYHDFPDFERQRSISDSQRTQRYTNGLQPSNINYQSVNDGTLQDRRDFQSRDNRILYQGVYDNSMLPRADNKLENGSSNRLYELNRLPPESNLHEYGDRAEQTPSLANDRSHNTYKLNKQLENPYKRYDISYKPLEGGNQQPHRLLVQENSDPYYKPQLMRRDSRLDKREQLSPNLSASSQFYPTTDGDLMNEASQQYYEKMISQINSQIAMVTDNRKPDIYNPMLIVNSEDDENEWC